MKSLVFMLVMLSTLASCGFEVVDTGRRGIKVNMGQVVGEPLPEGLHFYNPFSEDIVEMSVRENSETYNLKTFSADNQEITVDVTVTSAPEPRKVGDIYKEYGDNYMEKIAKPAIVAAVKDILGQYSAENIASKRGELYQKTTLYVKEKLAARNLEVTGVDFVGIDFEPEYKRAVEAKVVAIQRAEEAKNRTKEVEEQKAQSILTAQGQAESIRIKAQALSQNAKLVELEAVQRWDGKLPTNMMGGAIPFINIK